MNFWQRQIERADELAEAATGSQELLEFYRRLLRAQEKVWERFHKAGWLPTGDLTSDLPGVEEASRPLLETVLRHGPEPLAAEARILLDDTSPDLASQLIEYWRRPSDLRFFGKAIIQC